MIKFFRKIRQSLLQQGKAGKYFTYAFGEIVLVVIGILIALQINNWNEERKANIAENKALVALKKEFEQNIDRFQFILQQRDSQQLALRAYFDIIGNENTPVEEKVKVLTGGYFGGSWGAQNTVLNGLVNSGAIDNIKNDSLKSLLIIQERTRQTLQIFTQVTLTYFLVISRAQKDTFKIFQVQIT